MSAPQSPVPPAVSGAWQPVADGLLRGLNHTLSNRVSALSSYGAFVEAGEELDPDHLQALVGEVAHLERLLRLYRLLPVSADGREEPVRISDALPDAADLLGSHLDLRTVPLRFEVADDAPPVLARLAALVQGLVLVLHEAGEAALAAGDGAAVQVRVFGAGDRVMTAVAATKAAGPAETTGPLAAALTALMPGAAVEALDAPAWGLVLSLPNLAAARAKR
ncbi:MAG: hypothetical protein HY275_11790 [Gemmatimonadetes bacterium]|nr:hypothetical protein [Gemmatimonadota bacterium]